MTISLAPSFLQTSIAEESVAVDTSAADARIMSFSERINARLAELTELEADIDML